MSHVVKMMSVDTIKKMELSLKSSLTPTAPAGSVFSAKIPGCTITAYKSGKVLFQGKNAEAEAVKWDGTASPAAKKSSAPKKPHRFAPPSNIADLAIIGSDEVGTGDYFGPITVAAAFVHPDQFALLKEIGVKDSKNLNDKQIIAIAKDLIHSIPYSLLILHNDKYNQMQSKGMTQGKMKAILHNRALQNVLNKLEGGAYDGILIDQFCEPDIYFSHIRNERDQLRDKIYFSTKGESVHLAVAAASILARYSFLKEMDKLGASINTVLPKGAGALVDVKAAELLQKHGSAVLNNLAKTHFANTKKAQALLQKKKG
ncbi:ribonuclease HIII [Fictibacillus aquaticus]|uniref:Ribonuclease HIII n=1 Tax=Fictibacillus aquaticus TaxID=2021314 RepID=A0A235FAC5_9BACL|nr:ribonuclease HIII [Fictibacillus aquaticus]OYD58139.1 ribonuclease HIII [Fictibacillus aquaticus]